MRQLSFLCVLLYIPFTTAADCPDLSALERKLRSSSAVPESCICSLFTKKYPNHVVIPVIQKYTRSHKVTDTLLLCTYRQTRQKEMTTVLAVVLKAWKKDNPSLSATLRSMQKFGASKRMDSLCTVIDTYGTISAIAMLQWVDIKIVINDLVPVPRLTCRIINERPQLTSVALNQFSRLLTDLSPKRCDTLLQEFTRCNFRHDKRFRTEIFPWLLDRFGEKFLFKQQINLLNSRKQSPQKRNTTLLDITRGRFSAKQYRAAAQTATTVYRAAAADSTKQTAAVLAYYSFLQAGESDSAVIWFERITLKSDDEICDAVTLYQNSGKFEKAAALLRKLPSSLSRDTLLLRYWLRTGALDSASGFMASDKGPLSRRPDILPLWKIRITLFEGRFEQCRTIIDSLEDLPKKHGASEILEYRYWLLRLDNSPEALANFSQIEYTLFKGDRKKAASLICEATFSSGLRAKLALRVAAEQLSNGEAADALRTLECAPSENDPAYLYTLAEACHQNGNNTKAESLLKKLLTEYPVSIHTSRGRMLLTALQKHRSQDK
jgi:tetratricopeptide (TPR) repeat protein